MSEFYNEILDPTEHVKKERNEQMNEESLQGQMQLPGF
jgi:hypothetical protein